MDRIMKKRTRVCRPIKEAQAEANILFEILRDSSKADRYQDVLDRNNLTIDNPTMILYVAWGLMTREKVLEQIRNNKTLYKKLKKKYIGPIIRSTESFFDESHGVTFQNADWLRFFYGGLLPELSLSCGECNNPEYKPFSQYQYRIKYNGEPIDMHWFEIIQYLTGVLNGFRKKPKSFTLKSSLIHEKIMKKTPATFYMVRLLDPTTDESFYKIGITTTTVPNRMNGMSIYNQSGEEVRTEGGIPYSYKIHIAHECNLYEAIWIEHQLKKASSQYQYTPQKKFNGCEECYSRFNRQSFIEAGVSK